MRATRKQKRPNFREFFADSSIGGSHNVNTKTNVDSKPNTVREQEKRLGDVRRMQDIYVKREKGPQGKADVLPSLKVEAPSVQGAPRVSDIDITDSELAYISKYFSDLDGNEDSTKSGYAVVSGLSSANMNSSSEERSTATYQDKGSIRSESKKLENLETEGECEGEEYSIDDMLKWATNLDINDL